MTAHSRAQRGQSGGGTTISERARGLAVVRRAMGVRV